MLDRVFDFADTEVRQVMVPRPDVVMLPITATVAEAAGIVEAVGVNSEGVQVGDYVNAATPLFALVSNHDLWVEANFKETDLRHMKVGDTATVTADAYPDQPFKAKVIGIGAATGSEFSLLPAQNATGNWVKVVQRIPVRTSSSSITSAMSMLSIRKMPAKPIPMPTAAIRVVVKSVTNHRGTMLTATTP